MQRMLSKDDASDSGTYPTTAQIHHGQLQDYELLLTVLREKVDSLSDFSQKLIRPSDFSPLYQEHQTGQAALQQLIENPAYRTLCLRKKVHPHLLIVTLNYGVFVYETSNSENKNKTELKLTGNADWQALRTRIEKSVPLLGGQIRFDRQISVPRFATFYAMAPWDPTKPKEQKAAIEALEEKMACYQLGLEEDFSMLDLKPRPGAEDRKVSIRNDGAAESQKEDSDQFFKGKIKTALQVFLPEGALSPLTHLAKDILDTANVEQVRSQPSVYLQKILQSPEARRLSDFLLATIEWYGGKPGEDTADHIRLKVVADALRIRFEDGLIAYRDRIAGYDLHASANWGKSYQTIGREFDNHLLTSKRAASDKEAIVMAKLFLSRFPAAFRITDIPADLPYRSSVAWVNFVNGVNLVISTDPQALYRQTFEKLVKLPLTLSKNATTEQLQRVSLARLSPTVDWAITQGILPEKNYEEYTRTEMEQAVTELDKYTNVLNNALVSLSEEAPQRLSIAKDIVDAYLYVYDGDAPKSPFWSEHKLALVAPAAELNPQDHVIEQYSIIDVVAEEKLNSRLPWSIFQNTGPRTQYSIWMNEHRKIQTAGSLLLMGGGTLPNAKALFEKRFEKYLAALTPAYETLIQSLLSSLPRSDRQALESGTLRVFTLRKSTHRIEAKDETPAIILPLRARNGLILLTAYKGVLHTFELLPKAGVIRRIDNIEQSLFGGALRYEDWPIQTRANSVEVLRHKTLPFDWNAHSTGSAPRNGVHCEAIIERLGDTFMAPTQHADGIALGIDSNRRREISRFIASELLFVDPVELRKAAYGTTKFDRDAASQKIITDVIKMLIPFWKAIEDITSDDTERKVNGAFGLWMDVLSFGLPIGRFASGSVKLLRNAGRLTISSRLTAFASLTKEVSLVALQALNPIDGIAQLLKASGSGVWKLGKFGIFKFKAFAGKAGQYSFVKSLPQIDNPGHWRPLASGDKLASVKGIDDVPVRNLSDRGKGDYRLVDPRSSKPYGPSLSTASSELSFGRSYYSLLETHDTHAVVEVAKTTRVRKVLEFDGRTTVFLDDVAYRLDAHTLRRVNSLDASEKLKPLPCRSRRAVDDVCKTRYVLADTPAERPEPGTIIEEKSWAPWFGDGTFHPSTPKTANERSLLAFEGTIYEFKDAKLNTYKGKPEWIGLTQKAPVPKETVSASLEFQTGIYGSIKVTGTAEKIDDLHIVGAIIVPSIDEKTNYLFTKLNVNDYYMTSIASGDSVLAPLTMKRLQSSDLVDGSVGEELARVYVGSLNANNTARIYGRVELERALDKLDEIAIPLGAPKTPSNNMKHIKVDTYSAEALMFDHRTRLMVADLADGATVWKPSTQVTDELQKSIAATINTLFSNPPSSSGSIPKIFSIDQAMEELQKLLPQRPLSDGLKNIAYAHVRTATGNNEVYVSVSGAGDSTRHLPLFKSSNGQSAVDLQGTTYFNIDPLRAPVAPVALHLSADGKLLAIPHPIADASKVDRINWATSADSESKLVGFINEKYPNPEDIKSITLVTTLPPCDSCSIVMKEFGHERGVAALNVIWGKRPNPRKRPAMEDSSTSGSSASSSSSSSSPESSSSQPRSTDDPD